MPNQPLAFAELLAGGVLLTAAIAGGSVRDALAGNSSGPKPLGEGDTVTDGGNLSGPGAAAPELVPLSSAGGGHYVNPLAKARPVPNRVDQGVDYGVSGPIVAAGDAVVKFVGDYAGFGSYVAYELQSGPYAGHSIFVAEGITPTVRVGQHVKAGQQIAQGHGGIETGWAQSGAGFLPLAKVTGGYSEGDTTAAGASFNRFLHALGAPLGRLGSGIRGDLQGLGLP